MGIEDKESQEPNEPTKEEIRHYFVRFGRKIYSKLKILQDPQLNVGGPRAKKEGWFVGHHAIVEAVLVLKVAELLQLSPEEKAKLLEAAVTHHAYKHIHFDNPEKGKDKERDFTDSRKVGEKTLLELGITQEVLDINEIADPKFFREVNAGSVPSLLQKIMVLTHEAIAATDKEKKNIWDITWGQHIEKARQLGDDYYEIQKNITGEIERELQRDIQAKNTSLSFNDGTPLALQLRKLIMDDIKNGKLPKI